MNSGDFLEIDYNNRKEVRIKCLLTRLKTSRASANSEPFFIILLDTDIMVDLLRGYEPAKEWLKFAQEIGAPGLVAMELIQGCQNMREQKRLEKKHYQNINFIGLMKMAAIGHWQVSLPAT